LGEGDVVLISRGVGAAAIRLCALAAGDAVTVILSRLRVYGQCGHRSGRDRVPGCDRDQDWRARRQSRQSPS
jgi:hypothetical protein